MTVLITLTAAGTDTGPFNLYSNLDGYVTPFESGITKGALLGGYTSILAPDYTTTVRVKSTGDCINYVDIQLVYPTTTTTTTVAPTTTTTTTVAPTTTTTTTLPLCVDSITIDVTVPGTFDYETCNNVIQSIGVGIGIQVFNFSDPLCMLRDSQAGSAMYTLVSYGGECVFTTTTTTTV